MKNKKKIIIKQEELIKQMNTLNKLEDECRSGGLAEYVRRVAIKTCNESITEIKEQLEILKAKNEAPFKDLVIDESTKFERCNNDLFNRWNIALNGKQLTDEQSKFYTQLKEAEDEWDDACIVTGHTGTNPYPKIISKFFN